MGKGEIARYKQFFSFSYSVFYPFRELSAISSNSKLSSAKSLSLEESKICRLGKLTRATHAGPNDRL